MAVELPEKFRTLQNYYLGESETRAWSSKEADLDRSRISATKLSRYMPKLEKLADQFEAQKMRLQSLDNAPGKDSRFDPDKHRAEVKEQTDQLYHLWRDLFNEHRRCFKHVLWMARYPVGDQVSTHWVTINNKVNDILHKGFPIVSKSYDRRQTLSIKDQVEKLKENAMWLELQVEEFEYYWDRGLRGHPVNLLGSKILPGAETVEKDITVLHEKLRDAETDRKHTFDNADARDERGLLGDEGWNVLTKAWDIIGRVPKELDEIEATSGLAIEVKPIIRAGPATQPEHTRPGSHVGSHIHSGEHTIASGKITRASFNSWRPL